MELVLDAEWKNSPEGYPIYWTDEIHCIVCKEVGTQNWYEFHGDSLQEFKPFISKAEVLIAHNLVCADLHVFQRCLGVKFTVSPRNTLMGKEVEFIDTLDWSRRLWPDRPTPKGFKGAHGLDPWTARTGGRKPQIQDWQGLSTETYLERCRCDVENTELVYYKLLEEMQR